MKNKFTARIAAAMCLVIIISSFAACSVKDGNNLTTTAPFVNDYDENWFANGNYEPVTITNVELVQLVNDALGSDAAGWDGNLGSLSDEQLEKVEQAAQDKGLIIEKDPSGNTVIKKDEIPTTQATPAEITKIQNIVSVQDMSNVSPSQYAEISKVAASNNMAAVTKPGSSEVVIVKPAVTRPVQQTQGGVSPQLTQTPSQGAQNPPLVEDPPTYIPNKTEKPAVQGTTSVYVPTPNKPVPTIAPTKVPVPTFSSAWVNTVSDTKNDIFYASEPFEKGVVSVGITYPQKATEAGAHIVAFNEKGKAIWEHVFVGDDQTTFEDVAVLADGSIVAVGYTAIDNQLSGFTDADFKCKGTIEGIAVRFNKNGDILWKKTFGGSAGEMIYSITATPDGGFVIGGKSDSSDGDLKDIGTLKIKAFIFKCDANGNIQWRQGLSGTKHSAVLSLTSNPAGEVYGTIECVTGDGEFAEIEGTKKARRTTVVVKLNPAGNFVWKKCFYDSGITQLLSIETAADGGCVVAGHYTSAASGTNGSFKDFYNAGTPGTYDCMIVKMDPTGKVNWMTPLIGFESDYVKDIVKIKGGYAVTGYTTSSNRDFPVSNKGDNDIFIYTFNEYGTKKNIYSLGGSASDNSFGICSDGSESVYICGSTNSGDGYFAECSAKGSEGTAVGFVSRFELN